MKKAIIATFSKVLNRGANMQCYAMMKVLRDFGFEVEFLDAQIPHSKLSFKGRLLHKANTKAVAPFRKDKEFVFTREYRTYEELVTNPPVCDLFVVGSDQIWNTYLTKKLDPRVYFADYIKDARKIAYAASFGKDEWTPCTYDEEIKEAILKFDAIGVREPSGIDICKNVFNRNDAQWVVDPTMLLRQKDIIDLIPISNQDKPYKSSFIYLLCKPAAAISLLPNVKKELCGRFYEYGPIQTLLRPLSVPRWLERIHNSKTIITNSFHCMVMSILLHKDFYIIPTFPGRETRMVSLLRKLEIENRYVADVSSIVPKAPINYEKIDPIIETIRDNSINFLKSNIL